ncbi:hypothetical protein [Bradyrhizobium sp. SZCCHNR3015]|uniref:argonaute/piwi family protein n=1 Tax=Bradyrhizobium sp. SZCCHNR3015 TaxID=3057395 RepID=UPI002916D437|nr:hypothetical protein [Bradyrhizobium sp. SZCCHNR3015]
MTIETHFLPEPLLEFGYRQKLEHPQDGLFLYGPVDVPGTPQALHVGVIGTREGIALVEAWLKTLAGRVPTQRSDQMHTSSWPGFQAAFGVKLGGHPLVSIPVDGTAIFNAIRKSNRYDAVRSAVELFERAILDHYRVDERRPDVWLVVVPEVVHRYGRPQVAGPKDAVPSSLISERAAAEILRGGSLFPDMADEAQIYLFARNFHHQLKAQLLHKEVVVQVIRETTLDPSLERDRFGNPVRSVQEPARIAWNLATTLYFKGARAQPWQIADVRPRVCYVGLVFKEDPTPRQAGDACCAAQMFLNSGNGVVFRGALGPWRSPKNREFHLDAAKAEALVREVVKAYTRDHGAPPNELFIHARQRFEDKEWEGFRAAVPASTRLVGVRIRPTQDLRLFRPRADTPVLRGTAVTMSRREGYLWTTGYIPRLRTYPGFETPKPILVEINRGDANLVAVMRDVLSLTKINYNACDYASGLPVTLKFADRVGEILTASPRGMEAPPMPFRFYI